MNQWHDKKYKRNTRIKRSN